MPEETNENLEQPSFTRSCEYIRVHWKELASSLRGAGPGGKLDAFLRSSKPIAVEGDTLVLGCDSAFIKDKIDNPECRKLIQDKLRERFGKPDTIQCVIKQRPADRVTKNPLVKAALDMGAKITNVEERNE